MTALLFSGRVFKDLVIVPFHMHVEFLRFHLMLSYATILAHITQMPIDEFDIDLQLSPKH
jgi:hypothetical protein